MDTFMPVLYVSSTGYSMAPLNNLLKKEIKWDWSDKCQSAFEKIKKVLTSDLSLTHFHLKLENVIAADACELDLGAVILHKYENRKTKPILHASRSLIAAEKSYSQIAKEALVIIFAVKMFHKFIHGREFTLQTDHHPLLSIYRLKKGGCSHTYNK